MNALIDARAGSAAAQFAIIAPFVLILLGGIMDFGRYAYAGATLDDAIRQALRMAIVRSDVSGNPASQADVVGWVRQKATALDTTACTATVSYSDGNRPGSTITIRMVCPFTFLMPGLRHFGTRQLSHEAGLAITT